MQRRAFFLLSGLLPLAGCDDTPEATLPTAGPKTVSEEEHLLAMALARHGESLSPEDINRIRAQIARDRSAARRLAAFPLDNADEPVFAPSSRYATEEKS